MIGLSLASSLTDVVLAASSVARGGCAPRPDDGGVGVGSGGGGHSGGSAHHHSPPAVVAGRDHGGGGGAGPLVTDRAGVAGPGVLVTGAGARGGALALTRGAVLAVTARGTDGSQLSCSSRGRHRRSRLPEAVRHGAVLVTLLVLSGPVHGLRLDPGHDRLALELPHLLPEIPVGSLGVLVGVEGDVPRVVKRVLTGDDLGTAWASEQILN